MAKRQSAKQKPNPIETYAIWVVHGEQCYLCRKPVALDAVEIDHLIPERLVGKPDELARHLATFGLPMDFDVRGFGNRLPSCRPCNGKKRGKVFRATPLIQDRLDEAKTKAVKVVKLIAETVSDRKAGRAVGTLMRALEQGTESSEKTVSEFLRFHAQHRQSKLKVEPIRLGRGWSVIFEVEFRLGPLDGQIKRSGNPGFDGLKAELTLKIVGSLISQAKKAGTKLERYMGWNEPDQFVAALAKSKGWTAEERQARIPHHVYGVKEIVETRKSIRFIADYEGMQFPPPAASRPPPPKDSEYQI